MSEWIVQKTLEDIEIIQQKLRVPSGGVTAMVGCLGGDAYQRLFGGKAVPITLMDIKDGNPYASTFKRKGSNYCFTFTYKSSYRAGHQMKLRFNETTRVFEYDVDDGSQTYYEFL